MSKTIFNQSNVDFTKQTMFFGDDQNVQRFDTFKYPVFDKLTQTQLGYFWRPEEISLQKDRSDYAQFRPEQKHIFTSNLKYQTLLDSVQGRGPAIAFLPYCSLPELESCIVTWDFFETIHSRSYTHIIKNVYPNPSNVIDKIMDDKEILKRATSVTKHYDDFIDYAKNWDVNGKGSTRVLKKAITTHIIKNWMAGDDKEMKPLIKECHDDVIKMFKNVVEEEKEWCNYLFKDGSIIGLNERLLSRYVEWIANKRLRALNLDPLYDVPANQNPLPWTTHWLSSKGLQVAPQETEVESYIVGGIKQDVKKDQFSKFTL